MALRIYERDTDSLFLRLLRLQPGFCSFFATTLTGRTPAGTARIEGQTNHVGSSGKIDLVLAFANGPRFLIENKIDAGYSITRAGAGQPQRYQSTVAAWRARGVEAYSVLLAPERYLAGSRSAHIFDFRLAYERLRTQLQADSDLLLLDTAILQAELPYEPVPDAGAGQFFTSMRNLIRERFPDLVMKRDPNPDGIRPLGSHTIYFEASKTLRFHAGCPHPSMSLQCWDSGAPSASVKIMLGGLARLAHDRPKPPSSLADIGGYIRPATQSLGIVIDTPRFDTQKSLNEQFDDAIEALEAGVRLQRWWNENSDTFRTWLAV